MPEFNGTLITPIVVGHSPGPQPGQIELNDVTGAMDWYNGGQWVPMNVPRDGTTGQVLAKKTATSFDTEWIDPPAGSGGGGVNAAAIQVDAGTVAGSNAAGGYSGPLKFGPVVREDPAGFFTRTTDQLSVKEAGWYTIQGAVALGTALAASTPIGVVINKNGITQPGTQIVESSYYGQLSTAAMLYLLPTDLVDVRAWCQLAVTTWKLASLTVARVGGPKGDPGGTMGAVTGRWVAGPSNVSLGTAAITAIPIGTANASNTPGWVADSTGVTIPEAGWYSINVSGQVNNGATAGGGFLAPTYNGSISTEEEGTSNWPASLTQRFSVNSIVYLTAGMKVGVGVYSYGAGATFIANTGALAITRLGGPKGDKGDTGGNATVPMDTWHAVGSGGEPAFQNAWLNYAGGLPLQFRKDPLGKVQLRGIICAGTNSTTIFTLPAGYRPPGFVRFYNPASSFTGAPFVQVGSDGTVVPIGFGGGGAGAWIDVSTVEFDTDTVTQMPTGPKGDKGDSGGNATVPIEAWRKVGTAGEPAFLNSWQAYDSSVYFRKDPLGRVYLRGSVNGGGSATAAFQLPVGYRPVLAEQNRIRMIAIGNQPAVGQWEGQVNIGTDGLVLIYFTGAVGATYMSLDQISFDSGTVTEMPTGPQGPPGDPLAPPEAWHVVGAASEPAFVNGWSNFDVARPMSFRKYNGIIYLRGMVKGTTINTTAFTLPVGYRPDITLNLPVIAASALGYVYVTAAGLVVPAAGSLSWFDLAPIQFFPA